MDGELGTYIDAGCRLLQNENSAIRRQPSSDCHFLLVAAAQPVNQRRLVPRSDVEAIQEGPSTISLLAWRGEGPGSRAGDARVGEQIFRDRHAAEDTFSDTITG